MTISILAALVAASAFGQANKKAQVERGGYLVRIMGCNDCHTPWKMGQKGPEPDMTRALSGHPEAIAITAGAKLPDLAGYSILQLIFHVPIVLLLCWLFTWTLPYIPPVVP